MTAGGLQRSIGIGETPADSVWSRMRLWAMAHAAIDFFQGAVPAAIPYFVLDRHYSYLQASGLSLAATLGAALPQPLFGLLVDRRDRPWCVYGGIALAAAAAAGAGLATAYVLTCSLLLLCGVGVAMFHPAVPPSSWAPRPPGRG